jgi:hypothetical protein
VQRLETMKVNILPNRVFNSPLMQCVNFKNGMSINLIKLYKPYANGLEYAIYVTVKNSDNNQMFKSINQAIKEFDLLVAKNQIGTGIMSFYKRID